MTCFQTGLLVGLFLVVSLGLTGFSNEQALPAESEDGQLQCIPCSAKVEPQTETTCPYQITIQCWCETPIYVCCTRQMCDWPHDWAPYCNKCWFHDECYLQDCGIIIPEIATYPAGQRPL